MTHACMYLYIHPSTISFGVPRISEKEKQESQVGYFAVPERDFLFREFLSIFTSWTFYGAAISHFSSSSISSIITFCHIFLLVWRMLNIVQRNVNAPRAIFVFTFHVQINIYVGLLQFFFNRVNLINLFNPADLMVPRIQPIAFGTDIFLQFGLKLNC